MKTCEDIINDAVETYKKENPIPVTPHARDLGITEAWSENGLVCVNIRNYQRIATDEEYQALRIDSSRL
jgi:hypothetical protein